MSKINNHIEIVRSTSKALSSMSNKSVSAIFKTLSENYTKVGITTVNNIVDLNNLVNINPDLVFLGLEFIPSNPDLGSSDPDKIWISDYLDEYDIAYTGSDQMAHELQRNKHLAKQRVLDFGLNTSAYYVAKKNDSVNLDDILLNFPMFVKPTDRGGGLGIDARSVVNNHVQLLEKINSINLDLNSDALVENYLSGREFSVAILKKLDSDNYMTLPIELIAPTDENGVRILSNKVKSTDSEEVFELTDCFLRDRICELSLSVFHALGARDYGRIDIRLDEHGTPHFLESNLIPSLINNYGSFPKACVMNIDLDYESMIIHITNLGLARNANNIRKISQAKKGDNIFIPSEIIFETI